MKKTIICLVIPVIFFVACSKKNNNQAMLPAQLSIAGKWNVDSVNVYFYNIAGILEGSEIGYPTADPGSNYPLYFQFNDDHNWSEVLITTTATDVIAKGTYSYTSDNSFNLIYPDATPGKNSEPCNIILLTGTSFIFDKLVPSVFNGTDPGYIKYVYKLSK